MTREHDANLEQGRGNGLLWIIGGAVVLCAAAAYGMLQLNKLKAENQRLAQEVAELKMEAEIKLLVDGLKAPMEAIVRGPESWAKWEEARRPVMEEAGITHYLQFATVYLDLPGAKNFDLPLEAIPTRALAHVDISGSMSNSSYVGFWRNYAPRMCGHVTFYLKEDVPIGDYLRAHPEIFQERLRPLLLRLVRSNDRWLRMDACEALITGGDRTEAMLDVVREFVAEPERERRDKNNQPVMRFSSEKLKCLRLIEEYDLNIPVPKTAGTA